MVQHTGRRKQNADLALVKHHIKQLIKHLIDNCHFNARNVAMKVNCLPNGN